MLCEKRHRLYFLPLTRTCDYTFGFLIPVTIKTRICLLKGIPSPGVLLGTFRRIGPGLVLAIPLVLRGVCGGVVLPRLDGAAVGITLGVPLLSSHVCTRVQGGLISTFNKHFHRIVIKKTTVGRRIAGFLCGVGFPFAVNCNVARYKPLVDCSRGSRCIPNSYNRVLGNVVGIHVSSRSPCGGMKRVRIDNRGIVGNCCGGRRTASGIFARSN